MSLTKRLHALVSRRTHRPVVGLVRIVIALAATAEFISILPAMLRVRDPDVFRAPVVPWFGDHSPEILALVGCTWAVSGLAFLVGWRTRTAGTALATAIAALFLTEQQLYSNHLYFLLLACILLVAADCGAYASLDRRGRPDRQTPEWPLVLLQLQLSIMYFFAAVSKVNNVYLSGAILASVYRDQGPLAVPDVFSYPIVSLPLSWLAILLECYLALALWSPRSRPFAFALGFGLHAGILLMLDGAISFAIFGAAALAVYLLFLDVPREKVLVIWDDHCSFCRRWIAAFAVLDWLGIHRFLGSSSERVLAEFGVARDEADRALQMIEPDGQRCAGFSAVSVILDRLPLTFLLSPFLRLPPVAWLGARAYAAVAARRRCMLSIVQVDA